MSRRTDTKERILDIAAEMFAQKGFAATSITDIAEQVGVRGPAIYKHFANKLEIYEAVLDRMFDPMVDAAKVLDKAESPEDLQEMVQVIMQYHIANPKIALLVQHATISGGETLELLANKWYRPFMRSIHALADNDKHNWLRSSGVMAVHSMLLGYITLSSLHEKIFDADPLEGEMAEKQVEFLTRLVKALYLVPQTHWEYE